jgi:hypothetical protein
LRHANVYVQNSAVVVQVLMYWFRWRNTLFIPFFAGLVSCAVLLLQSIIATWRKRCENASDDATTQIAKSESRIYSGRFAKLFNFADEHGGSLLLAGKVERFLGSAVLLGLSLYDLLSEGNSRGFVGEVLLESRNLPQLGLVVTYVSCLLPLMV